MLRALAHQCGADDRERFAGAAAQPLELVEDHNQVIGQPAEGDELGVERLGVLLGRHP
jgi:hypothetical protein